jgi:hypothetical protein
VLTLSAKTYLRYLRGFSVVEIDQSTKSHPELAREGIEKGEICVQES